MVILKMSTKTEVPLSANAYITKHDKNSGELIGKLGLHNWTSDQTIISVYILAKKSAKFDLFIKCEVLPNGESTLQLTMNGTSHNVIVKGTEYQQFKVRQFEVKSSGYFKIDLKGVHKTGTYFADVSHLILEETNNEKSFQYISADVDRSTPAVYLDYKTPTDIHHEYYYNEVNVVKGYDPIGTFFMTIGFNDGYFGIQVINENERRILFSVWSPQKTDDQNKVTEENKVILNSKGIDVMVEDFQNEGTGGHAILKYKWTTETTYKLLLRGRPHPNEKTYSIYTAWFSMGESEWKLIASFKRPKSGHYLSGYSSFLEEFVIDTGYLTRKALFGNQWICDSTGNWHEVTRAEFSGNSSAEKNARPDFEGGVEDYHNHDQFYLKNGGFFLGKTKLHSILIRKENKIKPKIDFNLLPQNN